MFGTVEVKSVAAVKSTGNVVEKVVDTSSKVLTTTVKDAAKVGGNIGTAAAGLVGGAVKGTEKLAVGAEHAVAAVAGGAVKSVGAVGAAAVDVAHTTFTKPINADKVIPKAPATTMARN